MTRHHVLGALSVGLMAAIGACGNGGATGSGGHTGSGTPTGSGGAGSTTGPGGTGGMTGPGGGPATGPGGSTSTGPGTGGGTPTGTLCPDDLFSPKNANSVKVSDAVLMGDTVWDKGHVYLVTQSVELDAQMGGDPLPSLTIEAGTVVCFGSGVQLSVGGVYGGKLYVKGTAAEPVVFTAADDGTGHPDFWGGLDMNILADSSIAHLDIRYAGKGGGSGTPAFALEVGQSAPFLLDHLTVEGIQSHGIVINSALAAGSVITHDGYYPPDPNGPALLDSFVAELEATPSLNDPSVTLTFDLPKIPAEVRYIRVTHGPSLDHSITWNDLGMPYRLEDGLSVYNSYTAATFPTFTINQGVTVLMEGTLYIGNPQFQLQPDPGDLFIAGTAAKPVVFTSPSATPMPGDWGSVFFGQGAIDPALTKIDHAEFRYGGGPTGLPTDNNLSTCTDGLNGTGLIAIEGTGMYHGPPITNSLFASSAGDGIRSEWSTNLGDIIDLSYVDPAYGNTFMNNTGISALDLANLPADKCGP